MQKKSEKFRWESIRRVENRRLAGGHGRLYQKTSKLLAQLYGSRADGTYERRLAALLRVDVLILDDFGLTPMRPPGSEDLYEVIDGRYGRGSTVLTTNRDFDEWPELFDQPVLASAAIDRLAHGARRLTITGDSYRVRGPKGKGRRRPPPKRKR